MRTKEKAIDACRKAKLPVTLVPTLVRDLNTQNIGEMIRFLAKNIDIVKGIHFQPIAFVGRHEYDAKEQIEKRVTLFDVMHFIEEQTAGEIKYSDFYPITSGNTDRRAHV